MEKQEIGGDDMSEKRSPGNGSRPRGGAGQAGAQGVGGRQEAAPRAAGGGGYLDICGAPGFKRTAAAAFPADPRLDELRQIGLPYRWLQVAQSIGVDAFLITWQILDQENRDGGGGARARFRVPMFSRYLRFQRNRYVRTLAESGKRVHEIQQSVRLQLCEELSERHIARIISPALQSSNDE